MFAYMYIIIKGMGNIVFIEDKGQGKQAAFFPEKL